MALRGTADSAGAGFWRSGSLSMQLQLGGAGCGDRFGVLWRQAPRMRDTPQETYGVFGCAPQGPPQG